MKIVEDQQPAPQRGIKAYMARRVAHHEGSHAYCAHVLGVPLESATIVPTSGSLGHIVLTKRASTFNPAQMTPAQAETYVRKHSMVGFAGNAGTLRFTGENDWEGASEDLAVTRSIISRVALSDEDGEARFQMYRQEAEQLIKRDWILVCAVADALMQHKTLTGSQVGEVIARAKRRQSVEKIGQQKD
jgi:ATP-dependent Zn protease